MDRSLHALLKMAFLSIFSLFNWDKMWKSWFSAWIHGQQWPVKASNVQLYHHIAYIPGELGGVIKSEELFPEKNDAEKC